MSKKDEEIKETFTTDPKNEQTFAEFNPNTYITSDEHLSIIGGTQSGKTNHTIYYLRAQHKRGKKILMITAKPEEKYRNAFDTVVFDGESAIEQMMRVDPETKKNQIVLWEVDITEGDEVAEVINALGEYLRDNHADEKPPKITVAVDEYSLLVKHKQEGSDINIALQRASATWRAYNGQLVVIAQRSTMIHHTILTQSRFTVYRLPAGDLKSLEKIVYPKLDEEFLDYLDNNRFFFTVIDGFNENRFAPIPLQH